MRHQPKLVGNTPGSPNIESNSLLRDGLKSAEPGRGRRMGFAPGHPGLKVSPVKLRTAGTAASRLTLWRLLPGGAARRDMAATSLLEAWACPWPVERQRMLGCIGPVSSLQPQRRRR